MNQIGLYARTLRHLQPSQIAYRVVNRARRWEYSTPWRQSYYRRVLRHHLPSVPGWPASFQPIDQLDPPAPAPTGQRFDLLNEQHDLVSPADWAMPPASHLWRFHLHYFDWAWAIEEPSEFARLWATWHGAQQFGHGDAWSPYVVSLRAWTLCARYHPLVATTPIEHEVLDDLALYTGYLRRLLERDVGGNHLLKNLKALVGLAIFLHDDELLGFAASHIADQLPIQVLSDGGHYERSPSYHCQVLGDFLDIERLLAAADRQPIDGLGDAIHRMRGWLGAMLHPDGDVPLFNDCVLVGTKRVALLDPLPRPSELLTVLQPSGYVVMRPDDALHLVADVGPPCPDELPAHAQADCLSFELSAGGRRVVVDTGTSTYEPGRRRQFERSTAAHNTVAVDGEDQTEVWGTFRAAARAVPRLESAHEIDGRIEVTASHDGYERLPGRPRHRRTWHVSPGQVEIVDEVTGTGTHTAVARLHLASPVAVAAEPAHVEREVVVASGFSRTAPARLLEASSTGELPLRFTTTITP